MDYQLVGMITNAWRQLAGQPADPDISRNLTEALHQFVPEPEAWGVTTIDDVPTVLVLAGDALYKVTVQTGGESLARTRRLQLDRTSTTVDITNTWRYQQAIADHVCTWTFERDGVPFLSVETVERHGTPFEDRSTARLKDLVVQLTEKLGWTFPITEKA